MACRLPGGIESPAKLWDALLRGDDLVTEVPRDRWDTDHYYDPEPGVPGRTASKWGAFLDDVAGFDSDFLPPYILSRRVLFSSAIGLTLRHFGC